MAQRLKADNEETKFNRINKQNDYEVIINTPFCRDANRSISPMPEKVLYANKDLRPIQLKPTPIKSIREGIEISPVRELEELGRRCRQGDDDAPFNFQGMLRKTNYKRESLKRAPLEDVPIFGTRDEKLSFQDPKPKQKDAVIMDIKLNVNGNLNNHNAEENGNMSSANFIELTELYPGVFLEGVYSDL